MGESQAIITMVTLLLDALSRRGGMEGREAQLLDALRGRGGRERERGKPQLLEGEGRRGREGSHYALWSLCSLNGREWGMLPGKREAINTLSFLML